MKYTTDPQGKAAQFEQLLIVQDGVCGICREPGRLVLDHNHNTGDVRGLLCRSCNVLLGHIEGGTTNKEPGIEWMGQAIKYLEKPLPTYKRKRHKPRTG